MTSTAAKLIQPRDNRAQSPLLCRAAVRGAGMQWLDDIETRGRTLRLLTRAYAQGHWTSFCMTRTQRQKAEITADVVVRCGEVRDL